MNGTPTPTLQSFLDATSALEDGTFVRLRICHLDGKPKVLSLRTDLRYWPTWRLALDQRDRAATLTPAVDDYDGAMARQCR